MMFQGSILLRQIFFFQDSVKSDGQVDINRLNEGTSLLPETCDMFIKTLDDVMRLTDANFVYTLSTAR